MARFGRAYPVGAARPIKPFLYDATVALLHCDGTNGSTTFTDSSVLAANFTVGGAAQISTAQSKFGGASASFQTTGAYIKASAASANFTFATADFTIEFWVYVIAATAGNQTLYDARASSPSVVPFLFFNSSVVPIYNVNGVNFITGGSAVSTAAWHHIALCRANGSTRLFVDGTQTGSTFTDSLNYLNGGTGYPFIGSNFNAANPINGYIDELRITRGYARYIANFTAPTAAFDPASRP